MKTRYIDREFHFYFYFFFFGNLFIYVSFASKFHREIFRFENDGEGEDCSQQMRKWMGGDILNDEAGLL
jgi:hypothetical protein